jgi:hypothetical protein
LHCFWVYKLIIRARFYLIWGGKRKKMCLKIWCIYGEGQALGQINGPNVYRMECFSRSCPVFWCIGSDPSREYFAEAKTKWPSMASNPFERWGQRCAKGSIVIGGRKWAASVCRHERTYCIGSDQIRKNFAEGNKQVLDSIESNIWKRKGACRSTELLSAVEINASACRRGKNAFGQIVKISTEEKRGPWHRTFEWWGQRELSVIYKEKHAL